MSLSSVERFPAERIRDITRDLNPVQKTSAIASLCYHRQWQAQLKRHCTGNASGKLGKRLGIAQSNGGPTCLLAKTALREFREASSDPTNHNLPDTAQTI